MDPSPSTNPPTHAGTPRKAPPVHKSIKNVIPKKNLCVWAERLGDPDYAKRAAPDRGQHACTFGEIDFGTQDGHRTFDPNVDSDRHRESAVSGRAKSQSRRGDPSSAERIQSKSSRRRSMRDAVSLSPALLSSERPVYSAYEVPIPSRKRAKLDISLACSAPSSSAAFVNTQPCDALGRGRKGTRRGASIRHSAPIPVPFLDEREAVPVYETATTPNAWSAPPALQSGLEFPFPHDLSGYYNPNHSSDNVYYGVSMGSLPHTNQQALPSQATDTFYPGCQTYLQPNYMQFDQSNPAVNYWQFNPVTQSYTDDPTADQFANAYADAATTHPACTDPDPSFTLSQRGNPYPPIN